MMTSNELFYGDSDPVYVVDSPYSRRSRYDDKYYSSRSGSPGGGYYRGSSGRGRGLSDYYSDVDGLRGGDYYNRSGPDYFSRGGYSPDPYYSGSNTGYGPAYNDTYYDSRPNDYYDYRRPSTIVLKVPICCEECSEEARNALFELRGVRAVYCDVRSERVTVTGTAAPADVLQAVRSLHRKSRFWGDEDFY